MPPIPDIIPQNPPFFIVFVGGFAFLVLIGALLLWLPQASDVGRASFTDALFTASSAVSCTGLTVIETSLWSEFGRWVILALVQLGGFGFMLISASLLFVLGSRVSLLDFRFSDAMDASSKPSCIKFALQTMGLTVLFEGLGVLAFYSRLSANLPGGEALRSAVFHSVSAFNNAGFTIMDSYARSTLYTDVYLLMTISLLVILGGISAPVLINLIGVRRWKNLSLNSKLAIPFTVGLLLAGFVAILVMEYGNPETFGYLSVQEKLGNAFFCSASARTAGFAAINIGSFGFQTLALLTVLMFIGGVAGSTAGGIKVNSFAILILTIRSYIMGHSRVHAFGKQIPEARVHEAISVLFLSLLVVCVPMLLLTLTEDLSRTGIVFESVSAFATVGLSTGITPGLSVAGKLILTLSMFIGRLGPLTIVLAISERRRSVEISEPEESVRVW